MDLLQSLPSSNSIGLEYLITLIVSASCTLSARNNWRLRRMEERIERLEQNAGLDTTFYHRKRKRRSYLFSALLLLCLAGCASPSPFLLRRTVDERGLEHYKPAPEARAVIGAGQVAGGPWGAIGGTLALAALSTWASMQNRRALNDHLNKKK